MRSRGFTIVSCSCLLAACADGAVSRNGQAGSSSRDSAGILIVENTRPVWDAQAWTVAPEPVFDIGGAGMEEAGALSGVQNAILLKDGTLVVADGGSQRIRFYDRQGSHIRDIGGPGEGPGEFTMMNVVGVVSGDSVAAWDSRAKRIVMFDSAGNLGRVTTVNDLSGFVVPAVGWLRDGSLLVTPGLAPRDLIAAKPGERRSPKRFILVSPAGELDTLAALPGREEFIRREGSSTFSVPVYFGRNAHAAPAAHSIYAGISDVFSIQHLGSDGQLRRIIRRSQEPRFVSADDLARLREQREADRERHRGLLALAGGASEGRQEEDAPQRETHPSFTKLLVDALQHLWVLEFDDGHSPQQWQVFDTAGIWLGTVATPARLEITWIGAEHVVGVYRDDMDVEHVRVHPLVRASR